MASTSEAGVDVEATPSTSTTSDANGEFCEERHTVVGQETEEPKPAEAFSTWDWWRLSAMERGTAQPEQPGGPSASDDAAMPPPAPADAPVGNAQKKFRCCICLEDHALEQQAMLEECQRSPHSACSQCMTMYLRLRIEDGRVDELRCPLFGDAGCTASATEADLRTWLSPEVCEKFHMFSRMRADPKLRACPQCNALCRPKVREDGEVVLEMMCEACSCQFCHRHGNAHAPGKEACEEYVRNVEVKELSVIRNISNLKACPRCRAFTEKVAGCNHMTCVSCKANWCWVCGKELDHVGWHYNPANPMGCMQFQEELRTRRARHLMVLCKIISMPAVLISFLLNIIFFLCLVITSPMPLCFCCKEIGFKVWVAVAASIIGVPFVSFAFIWAVIGFVIWMILCPCGAGEVHLQFLIGVPFLTTLALCEGIVGPDRAAAAQSVLSRSVQDDHPMEVNRPRSLEDEESETAGAFHSLQAEVSDEIEVPIDVPTLAELQWLHNLRTVASEAAPKSEQLKGTTTSL